jgi:nucleoside-diphosphate-sugar epimerase
MIFLQGGDGFLGSTIYKLLKKKKFKIKKVPKSNFKYKNCEIFINCSTNSKKYLSRTKNFYEFNNSIKNIKKTIVKFNFKKYILISTCEVYSDKNNNSEKSNIDFRNLSNYGFYKYLCELLIIKETQKWLILRCNGIIGENMRKGPIFDMINKKQVWANPNSQYQLIHAEDVAKIIIKLIKKNSYNKILNICSNDNEKIKNISNILGFNSKYKKNLPIVKYKFNNNRIKKIFNTKSTKSYLEKLKKKINYNYI